MKFKIILFAFIFLISIQCSSTTTEPQEITIEEESVELSWIKYGNEYAWTLPEDTGQVNGVSTVYECSQIILYTTSLLFTYTINGETMIENVDPGPFSNPSWVWKEK